MIAPRGSPAWPLPFFIGWSNNRFDGLHLKHSLETTTITACFKWNADHAAKLWFLSWLIIRTSMLIFRARHSVMNTSMLQLSPTWWVPMAHFQLGSFLIGLDSNSIPNALPSQKRRGNTTPGSPRWRRIRNEPCVRYLAHCVSAWSSAYRFLLPLSKCPTTSPSNPAYYEAHRA